jgi:membrane protein DedA with SNARE-associated domain
MQQELLTWIGRFSYPAVYLLLAGTGIGLPISEDVVLLTAGITVATGHADLALMIPVAFLGVFTGDTLLFRIGARLGPKLFEVKRLKSVLTPERVEAVRGRFQRYGAWTIFAARFLPGVRMPVFLLSGGFGVNQRRFWLADGPAALLFAPTLVYLGATFGEPALPYVRAFGGWALLGVGTLVLVVFAVRRLRGNPAKA